MLDQSLRLFLLRWPAATPAAVTSRLVGGPSLGVLEYGPQTRDIEPAEPRAMQTRRPMLGLADTREDELINTHAEDGQSLE